MKRTNKVAERDTMRAEYTRVALGRGVRGKYAHRARKATQVVVLEPDVAKAFTDGAKVNEVLRMVMKLARKAG